MLKEVCQIIVEIGGYRLAWVGYAENDNEKTVRPIAYKGYEEGWPIYTADLIAHAGVLDKGMHFIQKPFSRKDLAAKVREVLDQKS